MMKKNNSRCNELLNRYFSLLHEMAGELHVSRYGAEDADSLLLRILYSSVAPIALASLFDLNDDNDPISITHFKRRIHTQFECYRDMYHPSLDGLDLDSLVNDIYELFLKTGHMYHSNYHLRPVIRTEAKCGSVTLVRGQAPGMQVCRSGLGAYIVNPSATLDIVSIKRMFHLPDNQLKDYWMQITKNIPFRGQSDSLRENCEYLNIGEKKYWTDCPDKNVLSLARTKGLGEYIYYFYRIDEVEKYSQIEEWMVRDEQYIRIASACLSSHGKLQSIQYDDSYGPLVRLHLNYLLPPEEMQLYKLYSWPYDLRKSYGDQLPRCEIGSDFNDRLMIKEVFEGLKRVYESLGYTFKARSLRNERSEYYT